MSSEDEEDFFDDKLMMTSSAERGCYWFVISLVYLNMVNFMHLNSKVLSFWRDCLLLVSITLVVYTSIAGHAFCYPTHSTSRVK